MESNSQDSKKYPSFFDGDEELPKAANPVSTGALSINEDGTVNSEANRRLDTGAIPSFFGSSE